MLYMAVIYDSIYDKSRPSYIIGDSITFVSCGMEW